MNSKVRARFAPSPTGLLHIGNVHTAIFTWLFVRNNQGEFILRIEDTDRDRSAAEYEEMLLEDLAWLGLDWDEGVGVGGSKGPYRQTERMDLYRAYANKLLENGEAYECFCSPEQLERERTEALQAGKAPRYSGRCRNLSPEDRERLRTEGHQPVLRFKTPVGRTILVKDLIRGEISFNSSDLDDFIIVRSSGMPLYNFAVTIDDLTMGITHIVRADEHISNTPRQLLLYEAFREEPPIFAHVSMLLGPDRSKLSKRHGATSLREYREKGYLPEAVFNYLATLGWSLPEDREFADVSELTSLFDLSKVGRSPAVFDPDKMAWMNGVYLRQAELDYLADLAMPYFLAAGLCVSAEELDREWFKEVISVTRDSVANLSELPQQAKLFFKNIPEYEEKAMQLLNKEGVAEVLRAYRNSIPSWSDFSPDAVHVEMRKIPQELGVGMGKALRPLRAALTGQLSGPELNHIISLFGRKKVIRLLDYVLKTVLT